MIDEHHHGAHKETRGKWYRLVLVVIGVLGALAPFSFAAVSPPSVAHAADASPGNHSGFDPGNYSGESGKVDNFDTSYIEPNQYRYRNYCAPAASQVLISAWTSDVPDIDTLAFQEKTDPNRGTQLGNMVGPINRAIGRDYYIESAARSEGDFSNRIGRDILNKQHPLITGLQTRGNGYTLNGWTVATRHVVMIYGFNFGSSSQASVDYFETAGTVGGTTATGLNHYPDYQAFWSLVRLNNGQIW
jgi:hypothetical protein